MKCDGCNIKTNKLIKVEDFCFCEQCYPDIAVVCETCGDSFLIENVIIDEEGNIFCLNCKE
jgi:hypothetical protein